MSAHGERIPAAAGRISTGKGTATEILSKSFDIQKNAKLIEKVNASGHNSTLEHTFFNIAFEDVSVFAEQFIIEFRLASFTVKSRRYVDFADSGYYVPELDEAVAAEYTAFMDKCYAFYGELCEAGIPKEDARFVLPYSLHSNILCSLNARELLHMIKAMLYGRGASFEELKALGESLLAQVQSLTPGIYSAFKTADVKTLSQFNFPHGKAETKADVELLDAPQDASMLVAKSALIWDGYTANEADEILSSVENKRAVIEAVATSDRPRPLENAVYTFKVNGVSLSTITHFTRHRMQSILVPSLTTADRTKYIVPASVKAVDELYGKYIELFSELAKVYNSLKAKGVPEEKLVYVLMSGNTLDIVSSMNARELKLFFRLRTCNRAQWEVREFAEKMLMLCRENDPFLFSFYGPSCCTGGCPEGRMSCGKAEEMRKKYGR